MLKKNVLKNLVKKSLFFYHLILKKHKLYFILG